ncbi:MAG TPA: beta-propeller fold lactonase family protein [Gemmatimonadales bacterium]|jgi:DNA-binding beta-propeller fold protein YncE|nr:beta-propeller fold lactonase family protein [Gemmatimonadales bacterium]
MRRPALLAVPALAVLALFATRLVPGPLGRATLLPSGWRIEPAGRQVSVGTLPLNLVVTGNGLVFVTNNGYGENGVMRVDPVAGTAAWTLRLHAAWLGLAHVGTRGADTLWASGAGRNRVYRLVSTTLGHTWRTDTVVLADTAAKIFVAGLAVLPGRALVAAVGNLSDSVYLIDTRSLERRGAFAVGHRPYTAVADSTHLYVSNWGDSTVSVIDLTARPPVRPTAMFVGPHPSALTLGNGSLFVALAGSNGVARVDLKTGRVIEQLTVALDPRAPAGSDPNALALTPDGRTLYVAMAGNNAVAVVRVGSRAMRVAGLIPAGWYPTAVATSSDGRTLYVANGKGGGSGANPDGTYIGDVITGSVSIVPVPDSATLARYTARVYALSPYSNAALRGASNRPTAKPPIRHVVYVIRENRTYDQVFGDVAAGNGDATLAIFNDSVTPNAHAIAKRFVLFDNFYVDGEVSADGHEWSTRAFANDFNEKTWPQVYSDRRDWDLTSGEDLANRAESYLWDAAKRKGLWVVNFGEMTTDEADTIRTNIAGLKGITANRYPGFIMSIPDTVRANLFADSVASWDRQGRFPDLAILYLPRDHTSGRRADEPTPRAMVADNDLAIGRVVERLSRSPSWSSMALFAIEDDAQNGPDHVDAHRSVLLVASPFARRGVVDSTFYTTSSVLRTIGSLLDLPPLSQYDAGATPLWPAFAPRADLTPFAALPNRWPLDERNPHAFRSRVTDQDLAGPDMADEQELNAEIWASVRPHQRSPAPRTGFLRP